LRPAGIGRVFDRAFELYRANFLAIAGAALLVVGPVSLATSTLQTFAVRSLLPTLFTLADNQSDAVRAQMYSAAANALAPVLWLAEAYVAAAVMRAAPAMLFGERPRTRAILRAGAGRFLQYVAVSLIVLVAAGFGSLFLLLPGLAIAVAWSLAPVAAVVENGGVFAALGRSWALVRRDPFRVVRFFLALSVLAFLLQSAVSSPAQVRQAVDSLRNPEAIFQPLSAGWKTLEAVLGALAMALVYPFVQLSWFSFYIDQRARREGMDLIVRSAEEGTPAS
jgi:hypothetical protein